MKLLDSAKLRIDKLPKETVFTLSELFTGIEWKNFSKNDRLIAGRIFKMNVSNKKYPNVIIGHKNTNNQQQYIKK